MFFGNRLGSDFGLTFGSGKRRRLAASDARAAARRKRQRQRQRRRPVLEALEQKIEMATFLVTVGTGVGVGSWAYEEGLAFTTSGPNTVQLDVNVQLTSDGLEVLGGGKNLTVTGEAGQHFGFVASAGGGLQYDESAGTSSITFSGVPFTETGDTAAAISFTGSGLDGTFENAGITGFGAGVQALSGASLVVLGATINGASQEGILIGTNASASVSTTTVENANDAIFNEGILTGSGDTIETSKEGLITYYAPATTITNSTFTGETGNNNSWNFGCEVNGTEFPSPLAATFNFTGDTFTAVPSTAQCAAFSVSTVNNPNVTVQNCTFTNDACGSYVGQAPAPRQ